MIVNGWLCNTDFAKNLAPRLLSEITMLTAKSSQYILLKRGLKLVLLHMGPLISPNSVP